VKIIIASDPHVGQGFKYTYNQQGVSERSIDLVRMLAQLLDKAKEIEASGETIAFIFAGDFYAKINVNPFFRLKAYDFLREASNFGSVSIIAGNHDTPKNVEWASSLDDFSLIGGVKVYRSIKATLFFDGEETLGVLFVPYISPLYITDLLAKKHDKTINIDNINDLVYREIKKKIDKETEKIVNCKTKIAIVHFPITGMKYAGGHEDEDFILPMSYFDSFDRVIAGHIHKPSEDGKLIVVGSMEVMRRDEIDDHKRFLVLDTTTNEIESIPLRTRPCYEVNIEYDGNDSIEFNTLVRQSINFDIEGAIIYLVVKCSVGNRAFLKGQLDWDIFKHSFHVFLEFIAQDSETNQVDFQQFDIGYKEALVDYANAKIQDQELRESFISVGSEIIEKISKTFDDDLDS